MQEHRLQPLVNITMVTFNRLAFTRQSIESIWDTADFSFVLTVVDNHSDDGTIEYLQQASGNRRIHRLILNPENYGVAFAANQGWMEEESAYYMKIDNDVVFKKKGWLRPLVETCDKIGDLGGLAYNFETTSYPPTLVNGFRLRPKTGNLGGCCIMIPERVHRRLGFWCEEYFPYGEEDADMSVRMSRLGLKGYYMEDENIGVHLPEGRASPLSKGSFDSLFTEQDPAYRALKDGHRKKHTGKKGLFRINEKLYRKGLRPVFLRHGAPYRPSWRALLYVWWKYRTFNPWKKQRAEAPASSLNPRGRAGSVFL